jgi:hypothetical protein
MRKYTPGCPCVGIESPYPTVDIPDIWTCLDPYCDAVPRYYEFELTTITNVWFCPSCLGLNRIFRLAYDTVSLISWIDTTDDNTNLSCNVGTSTMQLAIWRTGDDCLAGDKDVAQYDLALSSWDCLDENTLNISGSPAYECGGWPSTITLTPVS